MPKRDVIALAADAAPGGGAGVAADDGVAADARDDGAAPGGQLEDAAGVAGARRADRGSTKRPRMRIYSDSSDEDSAPSVSNLGPEAAAHAHPRRSCRLAQARKASEWQLDLYGVRHNVNQLFRAINSSPNPHCGANRLRKVIVDVYLMGYCRKRLKSNMWGHLLQVSGDRAFRAANRITKVERRFSPGELPERLSPLNTRLYGPLCDGEVSDSDVHTSDESDDARSLRGEEDDVSDATGQELSDATMAGGELSSASTASSPRLGVEERLSQEFSDFDWTASSQSSQPWLSVVVADTNSSDEQCTVPSSGGCRKMMFGSSCPYPCGKTFLSDSSASQDN
ncbi:regulatory protein ICP22 [Leporid alphaherpesvirus 4]|uniref:Regulatory protein ICP22 n=1 Tax=Leporid alphaherpesvirus 4 TaxID=481315 RepID=J9QWN2_9ALPH|nr:regulatory protein ICP22 [Leporid alphaherpesvirus 4]AFR32504.1 regulatory protein ICP22 [Leporid alphaherpesvirus 4]